MDGPHPVAGKRPGVEGEYGAWRLESQMLYAQMRHTKGVIEIPEEEDHLGRWAYPQDDRVLSEFSHGHRELKNQRQKPAGPKPTSGSYRVYTLSEATSMTKGTDGWRSVWPDHWVRWAEGIIKEWPCDPDFFERELKEYSDGKFVSDTIRHGAWVVDPEAEIPKFRVNNAKKAVEGFYRPMVDVALQGDVDAGWAMEPPAGFTGRDDHVHPVTAAPKNSDHPEMVRVCHDHSRPGEGSVNDFQRFAHTEWTHTRAIRERVTRGCWMRKLDIQYYYRNFGVRPENWRYTAFVWPPTGEEGSKVWWDNRLQFGYRNAPEIAMRITCALVWIAHRRGCTGVIGLMDDFAIFA